MTDPGTSVQPETLRFISYNILEGMKLDKAQNFDNFVDWVKEKDPDFMALCELYRVVCFHVVRWFICCNAGLRRRR